MKKLFSISLLFISLFASAQTIKQKQVVDLSDSLNARLSNAYKRSDSFFVKKGNTEIFIGKDSSGSGTTYTAGKGIDLSSNIASIKANYRSLPSFSEQSFNSLSWSKQTDNTASDHWHDGVNGGSIGDSLLALGGWYNGGGPLVNDTILYTVDKGATWHFFGHLPFSGHAFVTIDAPDGYHYLKPNDGFSDPSELLKVYRTKDYRNWTTLTFPFAEISADGFADDDANIYILGGQTGTLSTTGVGRIYKSSDHGATWTLLTNDVSVNGHHFLKGNLRGCVTYIDGKAVVAGGGLYDDDPGSRTYSQKAYAVNVEDIADSTKWWKLPDMPLSSGRQYLSKAVFDGKRFYGFGADATGNQQDICYLDKSFQWHTFYNYLGNDRSSLLTATHAAPFYVHNGSMYRFLGNGTNETYILQKGIIDPISIRDDIAVNYYTHLSETRDALGTILGNSVKADPLTPGGVIKTSSDPAHWLRMNYNDGISFHVNLTGSSGTTAAASDNMALKIDNTKLITVYNGLLINAGNFATNGEWYHSGYAGSTSRVLQIEADGKVKPIANGTDGQVLTLVSGLPSWADPSGSGGSADSSIYATRHYVDSVAASLGLSGGSSSGSSGDIQISNGSGGFITPSSSILNFNSTSNILKLGSGAKTSSGYTTFSETQGGLATVFGNSFIADPSTANQLTHTTSDYGNAITMRYDYGIKWYVHRNSNFTDAATPNMHLDNTGLLNLYNGLLINAGNFATNGEWYHQGYAGGGTHLTQIENDGKVKPSTIVPSEVITEGRLTDSLNARFSGLTGSIYTADESTLHLSGGVFSVKSTYDASLLHLAGSETITGSKTFSSSAPVAFYGGVFYDVIGLSSSGTAGAGKQHVYLTTSTSGQTLTLSSPGAGGFKVIMNIGSASWSIASSFGSVKDEHGSTFSTIAPYSTYYAIGDGSNWYITKLGGNTFTPPTSGAYTSTISNVANVSSSSAISDFTYQVSADGNVVTFSGAISITATSGSTTTTVEVTLPVASTFSSSGDLSGTVNSDSVFGYVYANTSNGKASITFKSPAAGSPGSVRFIAQYKITPP